MRTATYLVAALVMSSGGYLTYGQNDDAKAALRQKLTGQFTLTQVTEDRSAIVKEGTAMLLKKGGMTLSSFNEMPPCSNTVKNGGISTDMFCKLVSMSPDGSPVVRRQAAVGETLWLIDLRFEKSDVNFLVYSDAIDGVRYYAWLKFPFDKRQGPNPEEVTARIAEVLTLQPANNTVPTDNVALVEQPPAPRLEQVAGRYVMSQAPENHLQLNADGTLSLVQGGKSYSGAFTIEGNKLIGRIGTGAPQQEGVLQGDTLIDPNGSAWVKERAAPAAAAPAVAPLKLPSTYVSAQATADQLQLNADNSFSLQAAGESYHGTFVVNGNTVELSIRETGDKTMATIQGNNLTDSSGQTWPRRQQSAGTAPGGAVLENADVTKMAKAGFDDASIIAKITSSKCQFDTSTDALIQLKQSGVSPAVLKAVVGAGK